MVAEEGVIRLVTRGDDAGSCRTANVAIRDCAVRGILRNVSVLAVGPAVDHAARILRSCDGLCIGLHACITAEWEEVKWGPVLPTKVVRSLVDRRGYFRRTVQELHERGVECEELMAEVAAQLAVLRGLKLPVAYVDTHMGFEWLPGVRERMVAFAAREGLLYAPEAVRPLPRVEGHYSSSVAGVCASLAAAKPGTYALIGHPGYVRADMRRFGHKGYRDVARDRDEQRRWFMDPAVLACCEAHRVKPIRYTDVGEKE
ncbi:MAG: ChbG/HpnK family deacetylase [bacterium]|nr:ChbG/HpnK family deacetylase [bacterium]